jgi:hypothetical protein
MSQNQSNHNPVPMIFLIATILVVGTVFATLALMPRPAQPSAASPIPDTSALQQMATNLIVMFMAVIGIVTWLSMRQAQAAASRRQARAAALERYFAEKRAAYDQILPPLPTAPTKVAIQKQSISKPLPRWTHNPQSAIH